MTSFVLAGKMGRVPPYSRGNWATLSGERLSFLPIFSSMQYLFTAESCDVLACSVVGSSCTYFTHTYWGIQNYPLFKYCSNIEKSFVFRGHYHFKLDGSFAITSTNWQIHKPSTRANFPTTGQKAMPSCLEPFCSTDVKYCNLASVLSNH